MSLSSTNKKTQFILPTDYSGTLFPNWVMRNFSKYQLPKIVVEKGSDPCESIMTQSKYLEFNI